MEKNTFTLIDEEGNTRKFDVLFTFSSEETGHDYIVYTDGTKDKDGNTEVYASIYHPEEEHSKLEAIKTDKEWKIIDTILKTIQEELSKKSND